MIGIIFALIVIGFLMWLFNTYVPCPEPLKTIINVFVIILVVVWMLNQFVDFGEMGTFGPTHRYQLR